MVDHSGKTDPDCGDCDALHGSGHVQYLCGTKDRGLPAGQGGAGQSGTFWYPPANGNLVQQVALPAASVALSSCTKSRQGRERWSNQDTLEWDMRNLILFQWISHRITLY